MRLSYETIVASLALGQLCLITFIGIRLASYWWSFLLHWKRYRLLNRVTTGDLSRLDVPFIKIQITTRGSAGSSEVILRGIRNVVTLVQEAPTYYEHFISVEVVTESIPQARLMDRAFAHTGLNVSCLVIPKDYDTPDGTKLKARGLHFAVERRRAGWNRKPGRTFIVHYDEESVMVPDELRKLIAHLASTDKQILEGPIYYPLEYMDASVLCRAMEANRPVGCFECRHVMESGVPLHLHGSNLVIDEAIENDLGWDIGCLNGEPFIAEDYVFGMKAFVKYGKNIFGWHGCVMLEQPPFSFKSAFKQRHRWIFGVLQGMAMVRKHPAFLSLPLSTRVNVIWGTRYRIASFALGSVAGVSSFLLIPVVMPRLIESIAQGRVAPMPWIISLWLAAVGSMWLGSVFIGAWYNVGDAGLDSLGRAGEIARALVLAPLAGVLESSAGFWAVCQWSFGKRNVLWTPTPKTKMADQAINQRAAA